MLRIGKYRIYFTSRHWVQTYGPTRVKKILFMTVYWEFSNTRPTDVDKEQQFPPRTRMQHEGREYRYYRAKKDMKDGEGTI